MQDEEVRRAASSIHEELTDVYGFLQELEQLREVRDSVEAMSHATAANQKDLDGLNRDIADLERREQLYMAMLYSGRGRLIPLFQRITEMEIEALDSEDWASVEVEFHKEMEALIRLYIGRLERKVLRSNEIVERLLELSQNLPVRDLKQETLPYPGVATRFGPNEDGKYTGIRIGDREIHLSTGVSEVREFFDRDLETLDNLVETLPDEVERSFRHVEGICLQDTPYFAPNRV